MAGALLALVPPKGQQGWLAYMLSAPVYLAELAVYWLVGRHKQRTACPFLKVGDPRGRPTGSALAAAHRTDDSVAPPATQGNFAPVPEEGHFNDLPVAGDLPDDLSGCFLRTGPNPAFLPMGGYHWFDGDGMVRLWEPAHLPCQFCGDKAAKLRCPCTIAVCRTASRSCLVPRA